jgi:hypothetical protein
MNRKEFFFISLCIFLTVIAWLVADIFHATTKERLKDHPAIPVVKELQLDEGVLDQLNTKI